MTHSIIIKEYGHKIANIRTDHRSEDDGDETEVTSMN